MDWTALIIALLSGTTVGSIFEAIRYRRQNKRMKEAEAAKAENEVKDNETDTQMKQMNMADKYFDGMLKMLEQVKNSTENGNVNQEKMLNTLDDINKRVITVEETMGNIVTYLNGDYQLFLAEQIKRGQLQNQEEE